MSTRRRIARLAAVGALASSLCACSATPAPAADSASSRLELSAADAALAAAAARTFAPARSGQADAASQAYPNMYRRAGLSAGAAFYSNFDTTAQVDADGVIGATLDMEDFLGLDDDNLVARLDAFYAFSPRHRVDLSLYDISRNGTKTIGEDLQVGQVVIPAGDVDTSLDTLIVKLAYRYNFVADTRTAIGASFGLHTMGIDLSLDSPVFEVSESFSATAPLPVLGLHGEYALGERWKLLASAEMFQIDLGFAQGFVADNRLALEHDLFDHFGWGLAFNGFQLDGELEDAPLTTDLEYAYQGLLFYLRCYL